MPGVRRWRWVGLVVVLGAVAVALTVLPRQPGERGAIVPLLLAGLVVGVVAGLALTALPALRGWARGAGPRTGAARANDIAFAVVLVAVWALAAALLGRWSGLLTGVIVGLALAVAARGAMAAGRQGG